MKIIIIGNSSSGLYDFRGKLIQELIGLGNEIVALIPSGEHEDKLKEIGVEVINTPIDRRGTNPIKDISLIRMYNDIIKKENPDLVITYTIKPNIYAGYISRIKRIPYAVNITGLGTTFQNKGVLKTLIVFLYRIGLKKAKVVFFENVDNKDTLVKYKICQENRACVLNGAGVDIERFPYTEYRTDKTIKFLFIGRLMKEKGVDELFEAMRRLQLEKAPCELMMLGGYEEDYESIIDKYSQEGWLKYFGYQEDVKPFIEQSHCFVLPSWHEGMANTNLECASMGRPVITSNIHGCLEAVEDGVSGFLCEKQNADDLYKVMKKFIALSYEERKAMGIAGRKRMEEIFDKKDVVEKTISRLF